MGAKARSGSPGCRLSFWGTALGFDAGPSAPAPCCGTRHSDRQYRSPISVAPGAWACGRRRVASPRGSPSLRRGSSLPARRQCWRRGGLRRNPWSRRPRSSPTISVSPACGGSQADVAGGLLPPGSCVRCEVFWSSPLCAWANGGQEGLHSPPSNRSHLESGGRAEAGHRLPCLHG